MGRIGKMNPFPRSFLIHSSLGIFYLPFSFQDTAGQQDGVGTGRIRNSRYFRDVPEGTVSGFPCLSTHFVRVLPTLSSQPLASQSRVHPQTSPRGKRWRDNGSITSRSFFTFYILSVPLTLGSGTREARRWRTGGKVIKEWIHQH